MSLSSITMDPIVPAWVIVLLLCLGLAAVVMQYRVIRRKLGRKRSLVLSSLRLAAILFIVASGLNPSLMTEKVHRVAPALAIIVDTSMSMGLPAAAGEETRFDEARTFLAEGSNPVLHSLGEKFEVNVYGLGDSLRTLQPDDLARLKAEEGEGDIGAALKALGRKHSAVVLLSDGNLGWNGEEAGAFPVIAVPFGSPKEFRDVLIKEIKAPAFAFREREVVIDVTIKSYGYRDWSFPLLLKDASGLLAAQNIRPGGDPGETTVSFSFVPTQVGKKSLVVEIPRQEGEHVVTNNQVNLLLQVVPDKTRVLMVSGRPSMNYRFLRTALKSDPSIDLLSFVILRSPSDVLNVRTHEQSLIPFPVETLFSRELANFDLLVFDNFNYALFLRPDHLESIRNFVKEGGSFAMIGGPNLHHEEADGSSPIGEMLPTRFASKTFYRRSTPVRVKLSREGTKHPIFRFSDGLREEGTGNLRYWEDLPPLDGINLVEPKSSSTVLMEGADESWPVLTVGEHGKGRVLALTTDYSWKWYMGPLAQGRTGQPYQKLVHRIVRWLAKDPSLEPVRIIVPETVPPAGRGVDVRIQIAGASEKSEAAFSFSVFNPDEVKIGAELKPAQQPGEYFISFLPAEKGVYRIKVETPMGLFEESLLVAGPLDHFDAAPDLERLKRLAAATGGRYLSNRDELLREMEELGQRGERRFIEEKHLPIWATPVAMAIILGMLSLEWYLRRRWGLT